MVVGPIGARNGERMRCWKFVGRRGLSYREIRCNWHATQELAACGQRWEIMCDVFKLIQSSCIAMGQSTEAFGCQFCPRLIYGGWSKGGCHAVAITLP